MSPSSARVAGVKGTIKAWQLLVAGAVMFGFFFARPLYLAHRDGSATFWEKGIFFTGVVLYIGVASLFTDVSHGTHGVSAKGRETLTRKGWITLLSAAGTGVLLLMLFDGAVHGMGLHDSSNGPPLPRPSMSLPLPPANGGKEGQH